MVSKKFLIILVGILVVVGIGVSAFFISTRQVPLAQQTAPTSSATPNVGQPTSDTPSPVINRVSPTTTQSVRKKVEYVEGQYIGGIWKVKELVQDCDEELCMYYLVILLPEEMSTDDIWAVRVNVNSCVDDTLRGGDTARVRGIIEKVVSDIGLILSCNSPKTSITKN